MSNGAQAFAQVFGDRVRAYPGAKDEEMIRAMSPTRPSSRLATYFHVHLVSDSTGETLNAMAKAVIARFDGVIPIEHIYALVRSPRQMERVLEEVAGAPGVVLHTLVDRELREQLEEGCRRLQTPQIGALDPLVGALSGYLGTNISTRVGAQHALDHGYFNRIGALDFAIAHDDGQGTLDQLEHADVVLCGVSRTSKTPTCIYLANRGIRAANVPLVPGQEDGERLTQLKNPLVVGLTVSPDRLVQIRRNRLEGLNAARASDYVDHDAVRDETVKARRAFERRGWPTIDVTRRSVEETAAAIINLLSERRSRRQDTPGVLS
jgi:regulator of PEP synthase PpsR (kinase-PPPase family)